MFELILMHFSSMQFDCGYKLSLAKDFRCVETGDSLPRKDRNIITIFYSINWINRCMNCLGEYPENSHDKQAA